MTSQTITKIEQQMLAYLDNSQMKQLHAVLTSCLQEPTAQPDINHVQLFLAAKRVEGCSEKTIRYYDSTLRNALDTINKDVLQITTDDLRLYLDSYQSNRSAGKTTIDNIRRILSSFFAWLEDEDYIMKSPVRRIHKVKTCKTVKETYSDEALEIMRDHCGNSRDLALIDKIYIRGVLESEPLQRDMERNIRGVAVKRINIGYLRLLGIPMCDRIEQDRLAKLYQQSDKSKKLASKIAEVISIEENIIGGMNYAGNFHGTKC